MPQPKAAKKVEKQITAAKVRNLERALQEERLGLVAIASAFLKTHGDPEALLNRLDAMVRHAVDDPTVKPRTKAAFLYAQQTIQRAYAIEMGKPQPLFDPDQTPDVGHVDAAKAKALADPPQHSQIGLAFNGDSDVAEAHDERMRTVEQVQDHIVRLVREKGALTDREIAFHYSYAMLSPAQSAAALKQARTELARTGRLVKGENKTEGGRSVPAWDVVERAALTA